MSAYLAYSYSCNLTTKKRDEIDLRTKKSREYSLFGPEPIKSPDSPVPEVTPAPAPNQPNGVAPTQPGFKPLGDGSRGAFIGAVSK